MEQYPHLFQPLKINGKYTFKNRIVSAPMAVHLALLGADVILLEGIRLAELREGVYLLNAAPLNLAGADGAPCRAILIDTEAE